MDRPRRRRLASGATSETVATALTLWRPRGRDSREGQALIEGAIAFVLLSMVALALVQFALFVHAQNVVIGAVQDGARAASGQDGTIGGGIERARSLVRAGLGTDADGVEVTGGTDGNTVTIEARGNLRLIVPWIGDAGVPLRARAVSQKEKFRVTR